VVALGSEDQEEEAEEAIIREAIGAKVVATEVMAAMVRVAMEATETTVAMEDMGAMADTVLVTTMDMDKEDGKDMDKAMADMEDMKVLVHMERHRSEEDMLVDIIRTTDRIMCPVSSVRAVLNGVNFILSPLLYSYLMVT